MRIQGRFGGKGLGRHGMLKVVTTQHALDPVDGLGVNRFGIASEIRQTPLLDLQRIGNVNDLQVVDRSARFDSVPVPPKVFAELGRIAAIGLAAGRLLGLDQNDPLTAEVT